jgi:hypothetical protein
LRCALWADDTKATQRGCCRVRTVLGTLYESEPGPWAAELQATCIAARQEPGFRVDQAVAGVERSVGREGIEVVRIRRGYVSDRLSRRRAKVRALLRADARPIAQWGAGLETADREGRPRRDLQQVGRNVRLGNAQGLADARLDRPTELLGGQSWPRVSRM